MVSGHQVEPHWLPDERFWYRVRVDVGNEFILVDPDRRRQRPAFDHARLAAALSVAADTAYEPYKLPFQEFELVDTGGAIRFTVNDSLRWTCDIRRYACGAPEPVPEDSMAERPSPDGAWEAFARDENLWVRSVETGEERQLSRDGEEDYGYAVQPEGCCTVITDRRRDAPAHPVLAWSPDSRRIATYRLDEREIGKLHILETKTGRPALHSYRYALPGDSAIPRFTVHIFDLESGDRVAVEMEPAVLGFGALMGDTLWTHARWSGDGSRLFFTDRDRDFKRVRLLAADAATGETTTVVDERSPTFVELTPRSRGAPNWRVLGNGAEVVWWSERDGWGHLYLYDGLGGGLMRQITAGPWVVVDVLHVDEANRWIYFTAVGREEARDPYHRFLYRARLDGTEVELLTPEAADHEISMSPSGRYVVDTYSRRDTMPVTVLRGPDGGELMRLEEGDVSRLLEAGWTWPAHFTVKARDGVTDLHGYLYFPSDFDPDRRYPIVDNIYPGPQIGPIGPRGFDPSPRGDPHGLAELGFIVMQLDAMGTPFRSKAFHDRWYGDMGDNGLPDHIAAIKQLAARHPQIDLERVGIYGHSGGGFSSTDAILRYPEFFKVAVSAAGNHDNRSYFYTWGEKYQGQLEDGPSGGDNYDSQANQNLADHLQGKLLLMYGTLDDNVHPNATLLLIDRLIEHNKDFDLLVLPNRNHGYAREPYVIRRRWDYFVEHLLGVEPPKEYRLERPGNGDGR